MSQSKKTDASSLVPVLLSALVYPGAGQFLQKRFTWGIVYGVAFTVVFIVCCVFTVRIVPGYFTAFLRGGELPAPEGWDPVIKSLVASLVIYAANVYDAWYAWFRNKRGIAMVRHPYV